MWTRVARKTCGARGLAALLVLLVCGGAVDWGHSGGDDTDCSVALVHHDHNDHRFSGPLPGHSEPSGHCAICHSLQLLHAALKPVHEGVVFEVQSAQYHRADDALARSASTRSLSSRAPPVVLL